MAAGSAPVSVPRDAQLIVSGWALDSSARSVAAGVYLCIDDDRCAIGQYGFDRPDVATATQNPAFRKCGFIVETAITDLAPGMHRLTLRIVTADGAAYLPAPHQFFFQVT
jgi:hypothetical protein